jgi:hypothetical protein
VDVDLQHQAGPSPPVRHLYTPGKVSPDLPGLVAKTVESVGSKGWRNVDSYSGEGVLDLDTFSRCASNVHPSESPTDDFGRTTIVEVEILDSGA